jgi:glycosyltransferase involved in cell wall biosynthesis
MTTPILSVITPVRNGARYIEQCLQNVIDQGCETLEHLVIDGASTDGTQEILRTWAAEYPHIRWQSQPDRGQSDAMNIGIAGARGSIVSFLNVDDFYEAGALNDVVQRFAVLPEPSLLVGNCNVWNSDGSLLFVGRPARLRLDELLLGPKVNLYPVNPSSYFYHRSLHSIIGDYRIDLHLSLDVEFLLRAVEAANTVYIDTTFGNQRFIPGTKSFDNGLRKRPQETIEDLYALRRRQLNPTRRARIEARRLVWQVGRGKQLIGERFQGRTKR